MSDHQSAREEIVVQTRQLLSELYPHAQNIRQLHGGLYSGLFAFEADGQKMVIKMPGEWFPLEGELYFFQQLQSFRIVPKLIDFDLKRNFMIMEFVEGRGIQDDLSPEDKIKLWQDYGRVVKIVHSLDVPGAGVYTDGQFKFETLRDFLESELKWLTNNPEFVKLVLTGDRLEVLKRYILDLPKIHKLLHGDLYLSNSLQVGSKVKVLIDPAGWRGGHPYLDLGVVYTDAMNWPGGTDHLEAFSQGYGGVDWQDKLLLAVSTFWEVILLAFFYASDKAEFSKRWPEKEPLLKDRFSKL